LITVGEGTYGAAYIIKHSWNLETKEQIGKCCSIADNIHIFLGGNHNMNLVTTFPFSEDSSHNNLFGTKGFNQFQRAILKLEMMFGLVLTFPLCPELKSEMKRNCSVLSRCKKRASLRGCWWQSSSTYQIYIQQ
jgi:hypothetical protein